MMANGFFFRYILITIALFVFTRYPYFSDLIGIEKNYTHYATYFASYMAEWFGLETSIADGNIIICEGFSLKVLFGCSGLEALLVYIAGVLAVTLPIQLKMKWIFIGSALLIAVNTLRLVFLLYVGLNYFDFFDLLHAYVTQGMMIYVSIVVFLIFSRRVAT